MNSRDDNGYAVAVSGDLFFSSKIRQAAKINNVVVDFVKNPDGLIDKLASRPPSLLVVDLNYKKIEPLELIKVLKITPGLKDIPVIGYLPHVEKDLKNKAVEAGYDIVLPRSRFSREVGDILKRYTGI
ncbi:MAG: response regulator [Deltaproteobacteria bacterium]